MGFRQFLRTLQDSGQLLTVRETVSRRYEVAALLKQLEPRPVLFEQVAESEFRVVGNLFCSKARVAHHFPVAPNEIISTLARAIEHPSRPIVVEKAPCQEVIQLNPDLQILPIPIHFPGDGGPYITAGVVITRHPEYGQNMDFHRCMPFSSTEMAMRVVSGRHFHTYLQELGQLEVAVCVGNLPNVLVAAATSVTIGLDELTIANSLQPLAVVKAKTVDLLVPAEAEFVLEGMVYRDRRHAEGPFVDLTETRDLVRMEPVFVLKAITHRRDAIWQALLPGALEHKLLMGMPREPTIFQAVSRVVHCLDVNVNPGGCSWLHAIVQIEKQHEGDGQRAIRAAFAGHTSCKHMFVVDHDIDIYDPLQVEWAMATRFQGDRDMIVLPQEAGSSLDPSAEPGTKMTTKIGFDLTAPLGQARANYEKVSYPGIDFQRFGLGEVDPGLLEKEQSRSDSIERA